jgi:UDP-N-acetylglucosamine 2-epimerase
LTRILICAGTRPELIKLSSLIRLAREDKRFEMSFCYTGQHYDFAMSQRFIEELALPEPDFNLGVREEDPAIQTSLIMLKSAKVIKNMRPEIVIVQGDTNSALGVALSAAKERALVAHVESGCRSFDRAMPEELNRVEISHVADLLFSPTRTCTNNLLREGIQKERIFEDGHPLVDVVDGVMDSIENNSVLARYHLNKEQYVLCTLHRQENVDSADSLRSILTALDMETRRNPIIFPMHPRTKKRISQFGLENLVRNIEVIPPVGYVEMLSLVKHAKFVLTDSGGLQQEASILGTYCVTMRAVTEWIETVSAGANILSGTGVSNIIGAIENVTKRAAKGRAPNVFKRRGATKKILDHLASVRRIR